MANINMAAVMMTMRHTLILTDTVSEGHVSLLCSRSSDSVTYGNTTHINTRDLVTTTETVAIDGE